MNKKCGQSVTTDERRAFTKVLGADKDKVHRDQTPETTFHLWLEPETGEVAVKVKIKVLSSFCDLCHDYYIYDVFAQRTLSAVIYFSICAISFLAFVCISIIRSYSHVVREIMFVWLYHTTRTWFLMNVMHSRFYVKYHIYIFLKIPFPRKFLFYQI